MIRGEGPVSMPSVSTSNPPVRQVGGSHLADDAVVKKAKQPIGHGIILRIRNMANRKGEVLQVEGGKDAPNAGDSGP